MHALGARARACVSACLPNGDARARARSCTLLEGCVLVWFCVQASTAELRGYLKPSLLSSCHTPCHAALPATRCSWGWACCCSVAVPTRADRPTRRARRCRCRRGGPVACGHCRRADVGLAQRHGCTPWRRHALRFFSSGRVLQLSWRLWPRVCRHCSPRDVPRRGGRRGGRGLVSAALHCEYPSYKKLWRFII